MTRASPPHPGAKTYILQNYIKSNAREYEGFRTVCISFAQGLHRVDMRLRLGLLQDPAAIERQIARELADAETRRKRMLKEASVPTVKTEAQMKRDEEIKDKERKKIEEEVKKPPRIRPLSEAKAIETGANFISEAFLFCVAGGLVVFEFFRGKRKDANRRGDVEDRLDELEQERSDLFQKMERIETILTTQMSSESRTLTTKAIEGLASAPAATTVASPSEPQETPKPTPAPKLKRRDSEGRPAPETKDNGSP
jgi:hypothetical protein